MIGSTSFANVSLANAGTDSRFVLRCGGHVLTMDELPTPPTPEPAPEPPSEPIPPEPIPIPDPPDPLDPPV
jgi:hypothetical protein